VVHVGSCIGCSPASSPVVILLGRALRERHVPERDDAQPLPEALYGLLDYAMLASHRRAFDPIEAAVSQVGQLLLVDVGLRFLGMARACSVVF
jgi:hypothetical protein